MKKGKRGTKEYGYYCDLCGEKICKYELDFDSNGYCVPLSHKKTDKQEVEYAELCHSCCKIIAEEVVGAF